MTLPTFVLTAEPASNWASTSHTVTLTSSSFDVVTGDILVVTASGADGAVVFGNLPVGGSLTYAQRFDQGTLGVSARVTGWTTVVDSDKSMTVAITRSDTQGTANWGFIVYCFRDHGGLGNVASVNGGTLGAPSLNVGTSATSAVVFINADWTALDGASRTWRTINSVTPTAGNGYEKVYFRQDTQVTIYGAYWPDVGSGGTVTTGLTAPTNQKFSAGAIEIKGTGVAAAKFASKGTLGANGNTTANQANVVLTTATTNVAIGDLAVVVVAVDNTSTTDQDASEISGVTSSPANTWTKAREWTNGQGTAQTGATVSMWYTVATAAMNTGSTITAAFTTSASADAQAIIGWCFTKPNGDVSIEATNILATDGADPAALDATTRDIECLRIRAIGSEGAASGTAPSLTPTGSWTAWGNGNSAATMSAAEMYARAEHIISVGTGSSSNPTGWAADNASVYVAFAPPASLLFLPGAAMTPLIVR